jgi:hypothetical protein
VHEAGVLQLGELTRELPVALLVPLAH